MLHYMNLLLSNVLCVVLSLSSSILTVQWFLLYLILISNVSLSLFLALFFIFFLSFFYLTFHEILYNSTMTYHLITSGLSMGVRQLIDYMIKRNHRCRDSRTLHQSCTFYFTKTSPIQVFALSPSTLIMAGVWPWNPIKLFTWDWSWP